MLTICSPAYAGESAPPPAYIAIIIDDLGDNLAAGRRAVALPGPIAYAFLPHTPHVRSLAREAHSRHKEVMLHLPMQAATHQTLGPGGITLNMTQQEFIHTLEEDLASVPHVVGVNNHMGSLITRHPGHMLWLMQELNRRGNLFFVDSRTTHTTVAQKVAQEAGVPNLRRDIFLDHDATPAAIARQFQRLIAVARKQGSAVGIGHPYPETLATLEALLPTLEAQNIYLVPVRELALNDRPPQHLTTDMAQSEPLPPTP